MAQAAVAPAVFAPRRDDVRRWLLQASGLAIALAALVGCGREPEIRRYQAPKVQALQSPASNRTAAGAEPTDRTLGAVLPLGEMAWFFKLTGPLDRVAPHAAAVEAFFASIEVAEGASQPQWTKPETWRERGGEGLRFATLVLDDAEPPLELTVTRLPSPESDTMGYVLANVNRWREQLQLPPIGPPALATTTERRPLAVGELWTVDLQGVAGQNAGMSAPFAGGARPAGPPPAPAAEGVRYEVPETWREKPASGLRKAAFDIGDAERRAEVTVIDLAAAGNPFVPNINRWRGQVGLPEAPADEIERESQDVELADGLTGRLVRLVGPEDASARQAILGAYIVDGDKVWFVKLQGDADLALGEVARFEAFVRSLQVR